MDNAGLIFDFLDIDGKIPLTPGEMARSMTVTFYPPHQRTERLDRFSGKLKEGFIDLGVKVIPFEESLNSDGRVKPGTIIIEQGEGKNKDLAIRKVSSLYENPVVGLNDSPPPIPENPTLQETLDSIVGVLAWNLAHVPIFVEDEQWTICTMNGAVIECGSWLDPKEEILHSLIPKLAAQVVPPKRDEINYREGVMDAEKSGYMPYINDFMSAAKIWRDNGLMLAHTSIEDLEYRNRFYKRIVSQYLDNRTGMSYGFMVKQLPVDVKPAIEVSSAPEKLATHNWEEEPVTFLDGSLYTIIKQFGKEWIIEVPDVWLLSTRSGCNKTELSPRRDILRLGLHNGRITLDVPPESSKEECRPSYDTYAILAHAIGNVITASILLNIDRNALFPKILSSNGLSISHWHGYPDKGYPLPGYVIHGEENPPVSCSTPQSAAYAFSGKRKSLEIFTDPLAGFRGDIHIEPHHGTNITGTLTLTETAAWVDEMHRAGKEAGKVVG
jgi:hypothetical protein